MPEDVEVEPLWPKVTGPYWGPSVELPTSLGIVDLHNFASFAGLHYDSAGILELNWKADDPRSVRLGGHIDGVRFVFCGVRTWSLTARDPEMPASEDRTLDHFLVSAARTGSYQIVFSFASGTEIDVTAGELHVTVTQ